MRLAALVVGRALFSAVLLFESALPSESHAQGRELDRAIQSLEGTDSAALESAIQTLGMSNSPRAVAPLAARVRKGLSPELLNAALDSLTVLGRPEAGPLLFELAQHRRPGVRVRSIEALVACRVQGSDRFLMAALSDGAPEVRAAAAGALGRVGRADATERLLLAFDRGVSEAAGSFGALANASQVPLILERLGRVPFAQMQPALEALLRRSDLTARARLDVVSALGELATAEAREFLASVLPLLGAPDDPVRRAAEDVVARIGQ